MFARATVPCNRWELIQWEAHLLWGRGVRAPRGGRSNGPYADSLPLSSQFQGGGGGGGGGSGGGVWGRLKGRGAPGPQQIRLKMTPSSR